MKIYLIEWHGPGNNMGDPGYQWVEKRAFKTRYRAKKFADANRGGIPREYYDILKLEIE